ncbi:MAG: hypothetical protein LLG04_13445 [Parachlamydia sp.]|nr:hypothetical protein [Parachlamydia sp.]
MDELYAESFFTASGTLVKKESPKPLFQEPVREVKKENIPKLPVQAPVEKAPVEKSLESYETVNQMNFYLDQLEKELFQAFENSSDFRFIIAKIRDKLREKKTQGIYELLTDLEELMELS